MIDEPVQISTDHALRVSAMTMRALSKATGRTMSDLMQDDTDEANRLQVIAFAELHRRAVALWPEPLPDPGELWERAGMVELDFVPVVADPLDGASSTTWPPSVDIGE